MGYTIGYIFIGICCFYLIRNLYVGLLYIWAAEVRKKVEEDLLTFERFRKIKYGLGCVPLDFRNYYLFVLNPFWWGFIDVFADKSWRQLFRDIKKDPTAAAFKFMKNI